MKRENMKELMEIASLKESGRNLILLALLIAAAHIAWRINTPVTMVNIHTINGVSGLVTLTVRVLAALGVSNYYAAKGRSAAWALLVFLLGFLGAIPYVFMKDLRGNKDA